MDRKAQILIVETEPESQEQLQALLVAHGFDAQCAVCDKDEASALIKTGSVLAVIALGCALDAVNGVEVKEYTKPVRVGRILDDIRKVLKRSEKADEKQVLAIGPWGLDLQASLLRDQSGLKGDVRLTEKERDILTILHENTDQSVSKDVLLKAVWGYVEGVETHTLETHIYRLRQKIEVDAASPQILLTTDEGYLLA